MAAQPRRRSQRLLDQIKQKQDWSTVLPPELWEEIGKRLQSGRDAASFRSMCRLWRAALPFTKFAPALMLPFDRESTDGTITFYRPTDGNTFTKDVPALALQGKVLCGSSHGWLALVDEAACLSLLNPFTRTTVALPPTDADFAFNFSRPAFMLDGRWVHHPSLYDGELHDVKLDEMRDVFFSEVVLSSPAGSGDCIAMALLTESLEVAFCRVGHDASWRLLNTGLTNEIRCIIHCRDKFMSISVNGQISICHVVGGIPTARPVQALDLPKQVSPLSYLQLNGELHLLGTVMQGRTRCTRLYKCNVFARARPVWSMVTNAGDLTLLTSHDVAAGKGLAEGTVSGLQRNSVYYSRHLGRCVYHDDTRCRHKLNLTLEIISIATGASEWLPYHQYTGGFPAGVYLLDYSASMDYCLKEGHVDG